MLNVAKKPLATEMIKQSLKESKNKNTLDWSFLLARLITFIGLIIVAIIIFLIYQSVQRIVATPLDKVIIQGDLTYVSKQQVQEIIFKNADNGFIKMDLKELQTQLSNLPWIEKVILQRKIPNSLIILIEEQKVVANWNESGVITEQGSIIQVEKQTPSLPAFWGDDSKLTAHYYTKFVESMDKSFLPIVKLEVGTSGVITFTLQRGLTVMMSRNAFKDQLDRLKKIILTPEVRDKIEEMDVIDLRYSNGFAVTFRQPQAKPRSLRRVN